ncbi:hypothetical protein FGO68_gene7487 [Halteria grandinella]|uniref:ubiquitinyl hydrolase 1 n=1 Tax=Halteria grandinella TaxID=5974 RepID=A0A8J8NNS4_HALGN|nr:hypothetical protein FGO68_gene7487 [Halteria grandinella]
MQQYYNNMVDKLAFLDQGISTEKIIYFEKQGADMMCGVHCINALLQGPYFDEVTMSQIALNLDQRERDIMAEAGFESKDYLKYMQEGSHNVANDGNFSIQVLEEALKTFGDIQCMPIEKPDVKKSIKDYSTEQAYICHSRDHWIAIRRLYGVWYNLNSTNIVPPGPQVISDFYLAAFLDSIKQTGYTIFVVRGSAIPATKRSHNVRENQMYFNVSFVEQFHKDNKNRKLNTSGADERELEAALQKSLQEMKEKEQMQHKSHGDDDDDEGGHMVGTVLNGGKGQQKEEKKFVAFQGKGVSMYESAAASGASEDQAMKDETAALYSVYGDDPELAFAIKMSMLEEEAKRLVVPDEPAADAPGSVILQIRMPDGNRIQRRFNCQIDTVQGVMNFVIKTSNKIGATVRLTTSGFPKKTFEKDVQGSLTLKDVGITKNEALIAEIKL